MEEMNGLAICVEKCFIIPVPLVSTLLYIRAEQHVVSVEKCFIIPVPLVSTLLYI